MNALQRQLTAPATDPARTVYIVDDEAGIRLSVTRMLDELGLTSWAFASGTDFLSAAVSLTPGCVLLDVQMPFMDGLKVIRSLDPRVSCWPIIVMTAHADVPMAVTAMKMGALEFIEKPFAPIILQQAAERGLARLEKTEGERMRREAAATRLQSLTSRERDVLDCLLKGKQNKVIAFELALSVRTVEMHRANLLRKVGVQTLQEVVAIMAQADGHDRQTAPTARR